MNAEQPRRVEVSPLNLRGIAHPLRVRIIGMLRTDGPATATILARRLDLNTGATSYHLRQLAEYGFVVEDVSRGEGRERWWKAAHDSSTFADPDELADDQGLGIAYLRSVAQLYADRIMSSVDEMPTLPRRWREVSSMSDRLLRLTPQEAQQLQDEVQEVVERYRKHDDVEGAPVDAKRGSFQFQYIPYAPDVERVDGEPDVDETEPNRD